MSSLPALLCATQACSSSEGAAPASTGGIVDDRSGASAGGSADGGRSTGAGGTGALNASGGFTNSSVSGGALNGGGVPGLAGAAGSAMTAAGGVAATGGVTASGGRRNSGGTTGNGGASGAAGALSAAGGNTMGSAGASGVPICATAAEGASATLTCPDGQIIDSVAFASYGTPTGTCGNFGVGDCNAASSETMVQSSCVGRRACTVAAENGTFGDPCHSVSKQLAISVSCVPGEPTQPTNTPYKGVANSPADQISALGATWCYNWGTTPKSTDCNDPYFVPMVWGSGDVASAIRSIGKAGYTTVLGFNEPNKSDQSNLTVAQAIALWPDLTSDPNIRVGSPAVSDDGRAWLEDFMDQARQKGLRVDFIAMHWYGWNEGSCVVSQLEGAVNWASQWGLPVWITEFGCMGSSNPDEKTVLDFFDNAIPMLAKHPLVERYAWYPWNTYNELYSSDSMTALGKAFTAAPQYRE